MSCYLDVVNVMVQLFITSYNHSHHSHQPTQRALMLTQKSQDLTSLIYPRWSMYGIFTNIGPINHPNVGKYTIHCHTWIIWVWFFTSPGDLHHFGWSGDQDDQLKDSAGFFDAQLAHGLGHQCIWDSENELFRSLGPWDVVYLWKNHRKTIGKWWFNGISWFSG